MLYWEKIDCVLLFWVLASLVCRSLMTGSCVVTIHKGGMPPAPLSKNCVLGAFFPAIIKSEGPPRRLYEYYRKASFINLTRWSLNEKKTRKGPASSFCSIGSGPRSVVARFSSIVALQKLLPLDSIH